MVKDVKLELVALRKANKISYDDIFTHSFNGTGVVQFITATPETIKIILNYGKTGKLIYDAVKQNLPEYYEKSYTSKYGKGVIPLELIDYAYNQCNIDGTGRLIFNVNLPLYNKYKNQPNVRLIDDIVFSETKDFSIVQLSFFHLFNSRLKDEKWCLFLNMLNYYIDEEVVSKAQFKKALPFYSFN